MHRKPGGKSWIMNIAEILDEIKKLAGQDVELKEKILKTRLEADPLSAFCRLCRELGFQIYEMCRRIFLCRDQTQYEWRW